MKWIKLNETPPELWYAAKTRTDVLHVRMWGKHKKIGAYFSLNGEEWFEIHDGDKRDRFEKESFHLIEWLDEENQTETATLPVGEDAPIWYTKKDIYNWLIHKNYSKEIAEELSEAWANDCQNAFKKGWEKAKNGNSHDTFNYKYFDEKVGEDVAKDFKEKVAEIMRDNITFSGQLRDYVIHGALDKIWKLHVAGASCGLKRVGELEAALKEIHPLATELSDILNAYRSEAPGWGAVAFRAMMIKNILNDIMPPKIKLIK